MRKFTKLWQLMMVLLVSSSIVLGPAYGQTTDSKTNLMKLQKAKKQVKSDAFDLTKIIDPNGPNFDVKGELDCPEGSLFDQSCIGFATGVTSEANPGYRVFQYYSGVAGNISTVTFWGLNAWFDGSGWVACSENPMEFNIEFYGDSGGAPDLSNLLESFTANLDGFDTGEPFGTIGNIWRYSFDIPGGVAYPDAWIMIQGSGATDCWFLWVDSGTPGTLSYQDAGSGPAVTTYVQSLCLGGTPSDIDVGVSDIISPATGPNLGMEDVTINIFNYGSEAQSNFDVYYTIDGGAAVTETVTATINGGESYEYTFTQQADLSAYGTYAIEACTDLVGDEVPANDCNDVSVQNFDPSQQCGFSVVLWDDYGDGWNDGTLTISVDGTVVLDNITIASGTGPETYYFDVINGADVNCVFVPGGWGYECSYYIYDNDENEVFSDGVGGVEPVGGSFTAVCIQFIYGDLAGTVTELATGSPVEGAEIMIDDMTTTTASDGTYTIEDVMIGTWDVYCNAAGYNPAMATGVEIVEGQTTTQDFALTSPTMDIQPLEIEVTIDPYATTTENVYITNNGDGVLDWAAQIVMSDDGTDEVGDILLELNVSAPAAETQMLGGEWDGTYFWTTGGGSATDPNKLYKFDIDGNLIDTYDQPAASSGWGIRDLAWDGTYLYGGNESQFYQIDPADGTFTLLFNQSWGTIRALAWVPSENAFYTKDFSNSLTKFDIAGNVLETVDVPEAGSAYGAAWDDMNNLLYIFDQSGTPATTFVEFDISAGAATGVTYVVPLLTGSTDQMAGGAFFATDLIPGKAVLGGLTQGTPDDMIFAMELGDAAAWLTIDPNNGTTGAGITDTMTVFFDATDILAGTTLEADIHFTSDPNVGEEDVHVILHVGDLANGFVEGNVLLDGIAPYNIGNVEDVEVFVGPYPSVSPDANGDYSVEVYPGTYDVISTLEGYTDGSVTGVVVTEGQTTSGVDLTMDSQYGMFTGTITDVDTGDPLENAIVTVLGTELSATTGADGVYEIILVAGTYDLKANHATYAPETVTGNTLGAQTTETVDFALTWQDVCDFSVVLWDDYGDGWNDGTLTISVDGNIVLDNITLATGSGPETYYFETGNGADVTCVFVAGGWGYECSYYIYDNEDNEVFSDGVGGVEPIGGTFVSYCIEILYGNLSGYVTEINYGTPVENATVASGSYSAITNADGYYEINDILVGVYDFEATAVWYWPSGPVSVEIFDGQTTEQDFEVDYMTGIDEVTLNGTNIFPNPASELVNINSDFNISTLKVYNFTGEVVFEGEINNTQTQINTSEFEVGVYLLQIFTDNGIVNKSVIIK